MAMDLTTGWSTAFRNRRAPITVFTGTFASDDPDNYLTTFISGIYGFVLLEYCMGDCHENVKAYLFALINRCFFLSSIFFLLVNAGP